MDRNSQEFDNKKNVMKKSSSLESNLETTPLNRSEKFARKKRDRRSLESSSEISWLKEKQKQLFDQPLPEKDEWALAWLEACTSKSLGVLVRTAIPGFQTNAFHVLKLNDLISSVEKLDDIKIYLNKSESFIGFKTCVDFSMNEEEVLSSKTKSGPTFFQLLKQAKKKNKIDLIGGSVVNNYPNDLNYEVFQIYCDCFHAEKHSNYNFSILADGCGVGLKSRKAAQRAVIAATQFINQTLAHSSQLVQTAENVAWVLIQAIAMAHEAIVSQKSSIDMGTTTLNICFAFMTPQGKKYLMVAGVGDCKSFLATQNSENQYECIDVSSSKRLNLDLRDPGGRIGPYNRDKVDGKYIDPDLRNLSLTCIPLPQGESIIFNMSDGVHDNFNPCVHGKNPYEVDVNLSSSIQWSDLPELTQQALADKYQNELLSHLINEVAKKDKINLDDMCKYLTGYCHQLTSFGRTFMIENPTLQELDDKKKSPGKMDHCSVVAFKV